MRSTDRSAGPRRSPPWPVVAAGGALAAESGILAGNLWNGAPTISALLTIGSVVGVFYLFRGRTIARQAALAWACVAVVLVSPALLVNHIMGGVDQPWFPWSLDGGLGFFVVSAPCLGVAALGLMGRGSRVFFGLICPACGSRRVSGVDVLFHQAHCGRCKSVWQVGAPHPESDVFE